MPNAIDEQISSLKVGVEFLLPEGGLYKKLATGKKLKIKFGMDPTAPDIHLGHAVVLSKLKQFQDNGHEIIILIGDFTARIGDPTGKSKTRPSLSVDEIKKNAKTYIDQVGRVLDKDKITIVFNSDWLSVISLEEFLKIAGKVTLSRIIERDDFQNRIAQNASIGFYELFYPLLQGYDSVVLDADVELGGTDQTFNLLMGRHLQEHFGKESQVIMTMPILEGLDGINKMSKSLGNYIGLCESEKEAYGKIMSISDELMWRYYSLLLLKPEQELKVMRKKVKTGKAHPMDLKKDLAYEIIKKFWSEDGAIKAKNNFEALFQKRDYSQAEEVSMPEDCDDILWIVSLLKNLGAIKGSSEAKRLLEGKAVEIDGKVISDFKANIKWKSGIIVKVGKHRIYKIR